MIIRPLRRSFDFSHFQGHRQFTQDNVALLTAAATQSYRSEAKQESFFKSQDSVESFHFLDSRENKSHEDTGTQVSLIETSDALIVAARGTPLSLKGPPDTRLQKQDVLTDLDTRPVKGYSDDYRLHAGFKRAADGIWDQLEPYLLKADREAKPIHFVGHSMGGSVAAILAARHMDQTGVLPETLLLVGSPAIGWGGAEKHFEENGLAGRTLNLRNNADPLPGSTIAGHGFGKFVYFDTDGKAEAKGGWHLGDRLRGLGKALLGETRQPLARHLPLEYLKAVSDPANGAAFQSSSHG